MSPERAIRTPRKFYKTNLEMDSAQSADAEVVKQLQELGFAHEACVQAATRSGNDLHTAAALLADRREGSGNAEGAGQHPAAERREESERRSQLPEAAEGSRTEGHAVVITGGQDEPWSLVGGVPESPLNVLSGVDHFNIHDTVRASRGCALVARR